MSFAKQKFLMLTESNLTNVSFMSRAFGIVSINSPPKLKSYRFSLKFSSRSLIGFHFAFRSITHYELVFIYGPRYG